VNIWIVNHYSGEPVDGIGNRHFSLGHQLVKRGHRVVVIASAYSHRTRQNEISMGRARWKKDSYHGVDYVWIRTPPYQTNGLDRVLNMVSFSQTIYATYRSWEVYTPDIIIGSSPHLFAALAAERIAHRLGIPFCLEIRDLWPETFIELGGYSPQHPAIRVMERIERFLYRQADIIISLLPGAMAHFAEKGVTEDKRVVWIPNGVDLSLAPEPTPPPERRDEFVVMYAGAHGKANALDSVLDAISILAERASNVKYRFRFVGEGPEKARLQQRSIDEGLNNVSFEPFVPRCQVLKMMQEADALIATLRDSDLYRYGMSLNKIHDYMASARPIVFGARSLNNPITDSGAGITVPPEDAAAMADAVETLACLPREERWKMGLAGWKYVEKRHDYSVLAEQLEDSLYQALHHERPQ
jgi:glycosyltransferase involved in cell wall biosynthesis